MSVQEALFVLCFFFVISLSTVRTVQILEFQRTRVEKIQALAFKTTRMDLLQYSCLLSLDPNTAHKNLRLKKKKNKVTNVEEIQSRPNHPDRFECWAQVLCREGLSGRRYWEVEWSGDVGVDIAVSYKDIGRKTKRNDSALGWNNKSWSLYCCPFNFTYWHKKESREIPVPPSERVGVYLDHSAGTLSFYSVPDTLSLTLLHRVQTKFTQPLYPGFGVEKGCCVRLCNLK